MATPITKEGETAEAVRLTGERDYFTVTGMPIISNH